MAKKPISIDPDIREAAETYVFNCLAILKEHGDEPVEDFDFDETVYKVAEYPQRIRNLARKEKERSMVFVFGSNESGIHGAGAAKIARHRYGAVMGRGEGHYGNSYAIPTRSGKFVTLPLPKIQEYVNNFIEYAKRHPELEFQVTMIGTGYAGLAHEDMAPMFVGAPSNCTFDEFWKDLLPEGTRFWGSHR